MKKNPNYDVSELPIVNYGLGFTPRNQKGTKEISVLIEQTARELFAGGLSYNFLINENTIYVFPRTREIALTIPPKLKEAGMDKWQIAGQEMGWLFTAKYNGIYALIDYEVLHTALKEVTLDDSGRDVFRARFV